MFYSFNQEEISTGSTTFSYAWLKTVAAFESKAKFLCARSLNSTLKPKPLKVNKALGDARKIG